MNFTEAMSLMKNGEKIRKSTWKENRYIYMSNESSCFSNEKNNYLYQISFNIDEFLANDWEVFDGVEFHSGLIVKDKDDDKSQENGSIPFTTISRKKRINNYKVHILKIKKENKTMTKEVMTKRKI